jgi:alkylation response protein AidB-like acyl-CoA dehydrogenase
MEARSSDAYRFDPYLRALGDDWWLEDKLLQRWVARSGPTPRDLRLLEAFGRAAATRQRRIADAVDRPDRLPRIADRGPYHDPREEIALPHETREALAEVHGSGLWQAETDERARYGAVYLLNQNGEFGVTCSTACTDGLMRVLRAHPEDPRSRHVVQQLEDATPARWIHGAQFVTEVQGGSDAATNELEARPAEDGLFALTGRKWFCSNATADYWLVTGRNPEGAAGHRGIGLFCVPRLVDGIPNGHHLERLKDKLGTRALPTAEIAFSGARGWAVGPLDAGLRTMVSVVLTTSRIHNVVAAAGFARRAVREAHAYAGFRRAFGRTLAEHPLLAESLRRLREQADLFEAGAFATVDAWVAGTQHPEDRDRALWSRVLVSLAKATATRRLPGHVYEAMMVFGGNGIEERFCALPRLWRDAAILETWEGPYTLLLMNALGDLVRFGVAGREEAFLRGALGDHARSEDVHELARVLAAPDDPERIVQWGDLGPRLYRCFEARALDALA